MMQLALPKQNGCLKCVVQLDTKANERRGSRFPNFFASTQSNSCDEFLGEASRRCAYDQRLMSVSGARKRACNQTVMSGGVPISFIESATFLFEFGRVPCVLSIDSGALTLEG
jgi:hypothetical protein